ncbi:MAG: protein-disulfide reductase DsbD family protein [Blastocatellia bacterium]
MTLCLLAVTGQAQKTNPVSVTATVEPAQVKPGGRAKLIVSVNIQAPWHVYSLAQKKPPIAAELSLAEGSGFSADGKIVVPKAKKAFDPNFQIETETYEGAVTFTIPVKASDTATPGAQKLIAKFRYQACNEEQCLPPRTKEAEAEVTILAASAAVTAKPEATASASVSPTPKANLSPSATASVSPSATATPASSPAASPADTPAMTLPGAGSSGAGGAGLQTQNPRDQGLFQYLLGALLAGFASLLTPCVFPMIPITVSYFTKRQESSRGGAISQAVIYCLGIVLTFTALGLLLTALLGAGGISNVAANPWMNLFLMTLFTMFALNLFGLFEIRVPSTLLSQLDKQSQGSGTAATLLMGLTFALTSFTCTAAFVGTVLVTATQGAWFWAAMGMLVFATAFASPFFLLALFPGWLKTLPKSGGWMNSVKVVMGFLELAAAFKFLSNVDLVWGWNTVSRSLMLAAWIAIAIVTAIYLLGKFQLPYDTPIKNLGVMRMLTSVLFFGVAFYLLTGLFGGRLGEIDSYLPPLREGELAQIVRDSKGGGGAQQAQAKWIEDYDQAVKQARAANKPVFLNFTGVTCTNCRWMETNMFTQAEVKKELEQFVLAELFTDRETDEHAAGDARNQLFQEKEFGTVALPMYAIIKPNGDPNGDKVDKLVVFPSLTRNKAEFVQFLQKGAALAGQVARN